MDLDDTAEFIIYEDVANDRGKFVRKDESCCGIFLVLFILTIILTVI